MSRVRSWIILLLMTVVAAPVSGQDQDPDQGSSASRAGLLAGEREKKATTASPPVRSKVERALYKYDNGFGTPFIFQTWHGLHLAGGNFPAGAGLKFGV